MTQINLEFIKQFKPCQSGIDEYLEAGHKTFDGTCLDFLNLEEVSVENKLWLILRTEIIPENDLHELSCKFAEHVLPNFEKVYPEDKRPREAIEAKRKYIKGEITLDELNVAESAAESAESARSAWSAWSAARSAWSAWSAARSAAESARSAWSAWSAARSAAESAAESARSAWSAARSAARSAELEYQLNTVKEYFKGL